MIDLHNRRAFLRAAAAAGAAWAATDIARVEDALAWAAQQAGSSEAKRAQFSALTAEEAETIAAATERILPSVDGRAGAREAGAIYFIDRSLSTFNAAQKPLYADGVRDLNRRAAEKWKGARNFAALAAAQQDEILRDIEKKPFFEALRFDTVVGMFALPSWGGNRDFAGWHMLGLMHAARYDPPFGYYDAEVNKKG